MRIVGLLAIAGSMLTCRAPDAACEPTAPAPASSTGALSEHFFVMGTTDERVGVIRVSSDGQTLKVTYELAPGFELANAHVCAAATSFVWTAPGSCRWVADPLPPATQAHEIVIPLAALTPDACGAAVWLQVHGTVRGAGSTEEGSAYAGSFRGSIEHRLSCEPAQAQPGPACRKTQGFWKNHPEAWPVQELAIGGVVYAQAALLELFHTPPRGDASLVLAHQLVAAELNVATGSSAPEPALSAARAWMTASTDADDRLPYGVFEGHAAYGAGIGLSSELDAYNNSGH